METLIIDKLIQNRLVTAWSNPSTDEIRVEVAGTDGVLMRSYIFSEKAFAEILLQKITKESNRL